MANQRVLQGQAAILSLPRAQTFQFLNLPAELRNEVYRYCLTIDQPIYIRGDRSPGKSKFIVASTTGKWELSMSLLKTCSQLHNEAMFILYSENHFRAYTLDSLRLFCSGIGSDAMRCIQTLTIGNHELRRWFCWRNAIEDDYRHSFRYFSQMTNLKSLTLLMENEFERPHQVPGPMSASGALLSKDKSFEWLLPVLLPNLPRTVVNTWFGNKGLAPQVIFEVTMRVKKSRKLYYRHPVPYYVWLPGNIRTDRYRLAGNSMNHIGQGLSQIRK
ncbi:hypothetical protein Vi05172_g2594 [Venturia inaequalis]|nr:hypothetical protein Vi05172_g2594 [Venturia inaequalis]